MRTGREIGGGDFLPPPAPHPGLFGLDAADPSSSPIVAGGRAAGTEGQAATEPADMVPTRISPAMDNADLSGFLAIGPAIECQRNCRNGLRHRCAETAQCQRDGNNLFLGYFR
jgi:hypothetical protein